jgi:hypothetical protein
VDESHNDEHSKYSVSCIMWVGTATGGSSALSKATGYQVFEQRHSGYLILQPFPHPIHNHI